MKGVAETMPALRSAHFRLTFESLGAKARQQLALVQVAAAGDQDEIPERAVFEAAGGFALGLIEDAGGGTLP